ncbi:hypothetical protein CPB86DRAFT_472008 [Serendipita vermifera]|nr:hypothetical protein CPB86DRAFT_472008 [Serendipita vermifera]
MNSTQNSRKSLQRRPETPKRRGPDLTETSLAAWWNIDQAVSLNTNTTPFRRQQYEPLKWANAHLLMDEDGADFLIDDPYATPIPQPPSSKNIMNNKRRRSSVGASRLKASNRVSSAHKHRDLTLAELTPRSERRFRSRTSLTPRLIHLEASSKKGKQLPKTPVPSSFLQGRQPDLHVIDEVEYLEPVDMSPCAKVRNVARAEERSTPVRRRRSSQGTARKPSLETNINPVEVSRGKSPKFIQSQTPVSSSALPVAQLAIQETESLSRNSSATYVETTETIEQAEDDEDDDEQLHRSIPGAFDFVPAQMAAYEPLLANSILGALSEDSNPKHIKTSSKEKKNREYRPETPIGYLNTVQILIDPGTPEVHIQSSVEASSGAPPVTVPANPIDLNAANANQLVGSLSTKPDVQSLKSPPPKSQKKFLPSSKPTITMLPTTSSKAVTKPQKSSIKPPSPAKEKVRVKAAVPVTTKPFNHRIPISKEAAKSTSTTSTTSTTAPTKKLQSVTRAKEAQAESNAPARQNGIFSFVPQSLRDVLSRSLSSDSKSSSKAPESKSIEPSTRTEMHVAETFTTPVDPPIVPMQLPAILAPTERLEHIPITAPVISHSPKQTSRPSAKKRALELTPTKPKGNDQRLKRQKLTDEAMKESDILPIVLERNNMVPLRQPSPELQISKPRSRMNPENTIPNPPIFTSKIAQISSATANSRPSKSRTVDVVGHVNLPDHPHARVRGKGARADMDIFGSVNQNSLPASQDEPPRKRTMGALELPKAPQPLETVVPVQKRSKDIVQDPVQPGPTADSIIRHPIQILPPKEGKELPNPIAVPLQPQFAPLPPTVSRGIGVLDDLDDFTMPRVPEVREPKQPSVIQENVSKQRPVMDELDEPCRLTIPVSPKFMRAHKVRDQAKEERAMQSVRDAERANRRYPPPSSKRTKTGPKDRPLPPVR